MRLVVVNAVLHYRHQGELWAYGPYVREIEMWADLFSTVKIAAPCRRHEKPPGDCLRIRRTNICISPKIEVGGPGLLHKLPYLWKLPVLVWQLALDIVWSDAV